MVVFGTTQVSVCAWVDCGMLEGDGRSPGHMGAVGLCCDFGQNHSLFLAALQSRAVGHDGEVDRRSVPSGQIFHNDTSSAFPWNCGTAVSLHSNDVV